MAGGYINMDKTKTAALKDIVAIINRRGGQKKSEVICGRERYCSSTSSKKLSERVEGVKKRKDYR